MGVIVAGAYSDLRDAATLVTNQISPAASLSADLVVGYDRVDRESRTFIVTGTPQSLAAYQQARQRVTRDLDALNLLVTTDTPLPRTIVDVESRSHQWLSQTVEPAVARRQVVVFTDAEILTFTTRTTQEYVPVADQTSLLQRQVDDWQTQEFNHISDLARRLATTLVLSGLSLLALLAGAYVLLRRWVLNPLDSLRSQLQAVAHSGDRTEVITPSGPPELWAAGVDAEAMRRAIVSEADAARAADEGLAQEGPVVTALRAELTTKTDPTAHGVTIHGQVQPAQGVLAGDWWGPVILDSGRTALVLIDVSGHGELAGLVTLRLRSVITTALRAEADPSDALARAAGTLSDAVDGRFATAIIVILDPDAGEIIWANAGHPSGWLLPDGEVDARRELTTTGPLISVLGGEWSTARESFAGNDVVLLWSDGLVEARQEALEVNDELLSSVIAGCREKDPAELVPSLLAALRERSTDWRRDDITVVAARHSGKA
jgi:sigma-B regulation protein RsbU (phosphoserine phosphatase)